MSRGVLLSRVASSVYWMSRYLERAENLARFIEVTLNFSLDQPDCQVEQWEPLILATGDQDEFADRYGEFSERHVKQFLTFDQDYSSSILTAISMARENARTIREAISSEAWEELNTLYHFVRERARLDGQRADIDFYEQVVNHCYMFTGIMNATMTRGRTWHFATMGRFLERADKTSRILDVKYFTLLRRIEDVNTPFDDLLWSAVLRSACGFEMYRKRHHSITVPRIINFLILDARFPRAIRYCAEKLRNALAHVDGPSVDGSNAALQKAEEIIGQLHDCEAETIIDRGMHEFTDQLQQALNQVGACIHDVYFAERPFQSALQQQQNQ